MYRLLACVALSAAVVGFADPVYAVPITGGFGLSNPTTTITFDEFGDTYLFQPITTQFSSLGVTFDAGTGGAEDWELIPDSFGLPYFSNRSIQSGAALGIMMHFNSVVSAAAFGVVSAGSPFIFEALLGGLVVDQFQMAVAQPGFIGFQNVRFDTIRITRLDPDPAQNTLAIDNLQLQAVPEPATLLLVGSGLAFAVGRRRQRKIE